MKTIERAQAELLRRQGLTYGEIQKQIPVSQSSLSLWLRNIPLTEAQKERIHGKNMQTRLCFVEYAQKKHRAAMARHRAWREAAKSEAGLLSDEALKWIGSALYWAEGTKGISRGGLVSFSNSDPDMVRLMMRWFREICKVPEEKFRIWVQLHPGQSVEEAEAMWSQATGVPRNQFHRTTIKTSVSSLRKRGNILPYGVVQIRIGSAELFHRILGWIQGLAALSSSGQGHVPLTDETRVRSPLALRDAVVKQPWILKDAPWILRDIPLLKKPRQGKGFYFR